MRSVNGRGLVNVDTSDGYAFESAIVFDGHGGVDDSQSPGRLYGCGARGFNMVGTVGADAVGSGSRQGDEAVFAGAHLFVSRKWRTPRQ